MEGPTSCTQHVWRQLRKADAVRTERGLGPGHRPPRALPTGTQDPRPHRRRQQASRGFIGIRGRPSYSSSPAGRESTRWHSTAPRCRASAGAPPGRPRPGLRPAPAPPLRLCAKWAEILENKSLHEDEDCALGPAAELAQQLIRSSKPLWGQSHHSVSEPAGACAVKLAHFTDEATEREMKRKPSPDPGPAKCPDTCHPPEP